MKNQGDETTVVEGMMMTEAEGDEWDAFVINIGREITEEEYCEAFGIVVEWVPKGKEEEERAAMKYKKVANKTRPVATTLPEEYRIVRRLPAEPLKELPVLPINPGVFTPGERYTQERYKAMEINPEEFMWREEVKIGHKLIKIHEKHLAWTDKERGALKEEYFDPVRMGVISHEPWVEKSILVAPGI